MKKSFITDLLAGLTVSFAALSLGAAFGIQSERGALAGMLGAAIIPIIASVFGGTRVQASGPTAPMTTITSLIVASAYDQFQGEPILAEQYISMVILMSSVFMIVAGILKLGRYISYVPQVIVLGFMNGIALLVWIGQLNKLFGWNGKTPLTGGLSTNLILVLTTLLLIYLLPMLYKRVKVLNNIKRFLPAIFLTIIIVTVFTSMLNVQVERVVLDSQINTFKDFVSILKQYFPSDSRLLETTLLLSASKFAGQLCLLAYLDSLLTSLVVDRMMGEKTKYNKELIAQGLANGIAGLLQSIPGAQATIRSVLLIKEGAQHRIAGVFVGVFTLLGFLVFNELIILITSAVFIGILIKVGIDVLDRDFPIYYIKNKWYKNKKRNIQLAIIAYTTIMTVVIDLNIAVLSGTFIFHIGKRYFGFVDTEGNFAEVHGDNVHGVEVD